MYTRTTPPIQRQAAHQFMSTFINADQVGHVAIGPSTSQLLANLATCMTPLIHSSDHIIVHEVCLVHVANSFLTSLQHTLRHVHPHSNVTTHSTQQNTHSTQACHEANAGPWTRLAARTGAPLSWWPVDPTTRTSSLDTLETLLTPTTALVALTHVSNLLGEVVDVGAVVKLVRAKAPRARVVVDGVAYAPHRAVDVEAWDVDWYAFSSYKVCGWV